LRQPFLRQPFLRLPFLRQPFWRLPFWRLPFWRLPFWRLPFWHPTGPVSARLVLTGLALPSVDRPRDGGHSRQRDR
jgi:hypothetical protein